VAALLSTAGTSRAVAADTEVRDFSIQVDGKECGKYQMTIKRRDDGTVSMSGEAKVRITRFGITVYRYTYIGTEVWKDSKDGRLLALTSTSDDNGKKFDVNVTPDPSGLRVLVNGQPQMVRSDVWTMTYWKLPDDRFHNQGVPLLDADTGRYFNGRLDYLGPEKLTAAGQAQECYHFRVRDVPIPIDLWYDGQRRLVRQEFTEDGHRTIIQLSRVSR
jgi:hypothetical protein